MSFKKNGMQVALDDFGTGYSSLAYLKRLDIDYLKIDQSFVQHILTNHTDLVVCEAMILMAHELGLEVIAEGIETYDQQNILRSIGCDYGQGYLFSKPLDCIEFESYLKSTI